MTPAPDAGRNMSSLELVKHEIETEIIRTKGLRGLWLSRNLCTAYGTTAIVTETGMDCRCGKTMVKVGHSYLHPGSPVLLELQKRGLV